MNAFEKRLSFYAQCISFRDIFPLTYRLSFVFSTTLPCCVNGLAELTTVLPKYSYNVLEFTRIFQSREL